MARIVYDEPEDKKEYNKLRKNWNDTYNKKNRKYKGVEFEMDGVEKDLYDYNPQRRYYIDKPKKKNEKDKTDTARIIMLLIIDAIAFFILYLVMKEYGVSISNIILMFKEAF